MDVDHVVMTQLVELSRGNPGFDKWRDVIKYFGCKATRNPHFLDFIGCFQNDAHEVGRKRAKPEE